MTLMSMRKETVVSRIIGTLMLLFIPCFSVAQSCQNKSDSIVTKFDSLCQKCAKCKVDTIQMETCQQQVCFFFREKNQGRQINSVALRIPKFDPYKKKFNDMQLINLIAPHIRR